jgi:hypothetical protein
MEVYLKNFNFPQNFLEFFQRFSDFIDFSVSFSPPNNFHRQASFQPHHPNPKSNNNFITAQNI